MKRLDVRLEDRLYDQVVEAAILDKRSVNAQISWLLQYALIDWREHQDHESPIRKVATR